MAVAVTPRPGVRQTAGRLWTPGVRNVVAPVIAFVIFVVLWQLGVFNDLFGLETFAVPLPFDIVDAVNLERDLMWSRFKETFEAVVLGFVLGAVIGFACALLLVALPPTLARRADAAFSGIQGLPIIAIAPVVSVWVASLLWFKAITVVVLSAPPMLVYAYRGMTSLDSSALELARSYRASKWQILTLLRIPTAVPQIFTALRYSTVLALIGVVICEILKAHDGLGYAIHDALQKFDAPLAWGAVGILAVTGIVAYAALVLAERLLFPWSVRRGSP
jgi:NitT/TauT family transport system permease protein